MSRQESIYAAASKLALAERLSQVFTEKVAKIRAELDAAY